MRLDSLIILRIEWNSYVSYLRGKQWKYWRLKLYNLCCVLCCVVLCVVLCCVVLCCVLCVRPSSSSSVRPPSRPSVAVVRRRRPLSVRPSRPSSSTCESKAACKFSKKLQNMSPTATGLGASDRARSGDFSSRSEIAVRVEKVGFMTETLLL